MSQSLGPYTHRVSEDFHRHSGPHGHDLVCRGYMPNSKFPVLISRPPFSGRNTFYLSFPFPPLQKGQQFPYFLILFFSEIFKEFSHSHVQREVTEKICIYAFVLPFSGRKAT